MLKKLVNQTVRISTKIETDSKTGNPIRQTIETIDKTDPK